MCAADGTPSRRTIAERKVTHVGFEIVDKFAKGGRVGQQRGMPNRGASRGDVVLWGFRMTCLTQKQQLCVLGMAMFSCHVLQGILTEHVAKGVLSGLMWAAAAIELSVYAALSGIELAMTHKGFDIRTMPWRSYILIATCISVGRGLTWVGYGTLSYPTVLLFKSSKILVVMMTGIIILGKRFASAEYVAALLSVVGLYLFSVADRGSASGGGLGGDSIQGVGLMLLAVASEATVSTMQERVLHDKQRPLAEMIFLTNVLGAGLLLLIAGQAGEMTMLKDRLHQHPTALLWLLSTVVLAYGGSYAFTACIKGFGAVVATGVGICRKFVSVLASYSIFPKPVNAQHVVAILLFFAGMVLSWSHQISPKTANTDGQARQARGTDTKEDKAADERETMDDSVTTDQSLTPHASPHLDAASSSSVDTNADTEVHADTVSWGDNADSPTPAAMLLTPPTGSPGTPTVMLGRERARAKPRWGPETAMGAREVRFSSLAQGERLL